MKPRGLAPRTVHIVGALFRDIESRETIVTKLAAILDQIDSGSVLLPEFQRGYVWNRDQVRGLMRSLYLGLPGRRPAHLGDPG